jgi:protein-tyrosine phosphatase
MDRHLIWDGCANVRDLGGLRTRDGARIRRGAIVRADALDRLSARGWAALEASGVRTVIDLRNDDEVGTDAAPRPSGATTFHLPLDGIEDTEFWKDWQGRPEFGTPLYYRAFLDHFPDRTAAVITAIARAEPGGVAVHCGIGRDRTGLIAILLLALAGTEPEEIAADYALSEERLRTRHEQWFAEAPDEAALERLHRIAATPRESMVGVLEEIERRYGGVDGYLRAGGLTDGQLAGARARLRD